MAFTVAVAGKGGTGKTTLAALIVAELLKRNRTPVLAVDADPNTSLDQALGQRVSRTIGELREELLDQIRRLPPGLTKDDYLELGIQECLCEGTGVDVLAMGHGEGPRCYCAVNHVLRRCIDRLRGSYAYMVIDNEAGLEHLSRSTTQDVDVLLIVTNASASALQGACRISQLSENLSLKIRHRYLVLNNLNGADPQFLRTASEKVELEVIGLLPYDRQLVDLSLQGRSVHDLVNGSPSRLVVSEIVNRFLEK
jgi:CO dehydrogenase maturation factor